MTQLCEYSQIGRVGAVKLVGPNLVISVASEANYQKDGEWQKNTHWIDHTIFARQEGLLNWAKEKLEPGDLVFVRGTPFQTSWEDHGEKRYGVTFAVDALRRLNK